MEAVRQGMEVTEWIAIIALIASILGPVLSWFAASAVTKYRLDRAEADLQELRDWKHDHCEPAVRYVQFIQHERQRVSHGNQSQ